MDNFIHIQGGTYKEIKQALNQWVGLYSKDLQNDMVFQLFKNKSGHHCIQADKKLDNDRFFYLVNYLAYPEKIDYSIKVEGFTVGKNNNGLKNKSLLVYLSPTDREYDNVFVTTKENDNFKVDFGGRITKGEEEKPYSEPAIGALTLLDEIIVENQRKAKVKISTSAIEKRLKLLVFLLLFTFALSYLWVLTPRDFMRANGIIAFGVYIWFLTDYKLLQVSKLYYLSLGIAAVIFVYGMFLNTYFTEQKEFAQFTMTIPVFLLILQRPLRFGFKKIMKREPVIDKPSPSFADFIYTMLLLIISLVVPAVCFVR